eukprot:2392768-Alexandrium_andersonii.AAC.1
MKASVNKIDNKISDWKPAVKKFEPDLMGHYIAMPDKRLFLTEIRVMNVCIGKWRELHSAVSGAMDVEEMMKEMAGLMATRDRARTAVAVRTGLLILKKSKAADVANFFNELKCGISIPKALRERLEALSANNAS